ncbi:ATP synthase subunit I [Aliiruegeria lutimaris]|uniref:F1/F0 ATPase, subunit 2 n=1 Tax=Aliiruegeria lutimaris TaxID=571298 RepID=A0A1G9IHE5_9RHOB|nr:ATP synthase subunit I [Aliiruegeria lutimaris]SDL24486.1 F1/F0 ATPase, subunit 2 [Aliiruegeria lutimaris]
MTHTLATLPPLALAALGFAAGLALGFAHFASLRRIVTLYLSGAAPARALALQLVRFAVLVAALAALARIGATPLLAGALGLLAARTVVLRRTCGRA